MIEEFADVVAIDKGKITLTSQIKSTCGSCSQVKSCASGQVAKAIPKRKLHLVLPYERSNSSLPLNVGDSVVIALPDSGLLATAGQVYLLPLLGLIVFSALGEWLFVAQVLSHELFGLAIGLSGGYIGYRLAKLLDLKRNKSEQLQPRILRKLDPNIINVS